MHGATVKIGKGVIMNVKNTRIWKEENNETEQQAIRSRLQTGTYSVQV
jgi:hypothetical protein